MTGADDAAPEQRPELELDTGRKCERTLRADEEMREIRRLREERVEVITADPALHFGEARFDLVGLARAEREQVLHEITQRGWHVGKIRRDRPEMRRATVGQHGVDREHVIAHSPVAQGAPAARIIGRHAADGGARSGGDIHWKPQAMGLKRAIEVVEHNAGLDRAAPPGEVKLQNAVEVPRAVNHKRCVDRLPALRRAATAGEHAHSLGARDRNDPLCLGDGLWQHNAERRHLIMRRVGRITAAAEGIEQHPAGDFRAQPPL